MGVLFTTGTDISIKFAVDSANNLVFAWDTTQRLSVDLAGTSTPGRLMFGPMSAVIVRTAWGALVKSLL